MKHLRRYIHPQWGSILGSETEIRLAVIKDEVELCQKRDSITYLKNRIEEIEQEISEKKNLKAEESWEV
jgi:hypothetical protein